MAMDLKVSDLELSCYSEMVSAWEDIDEILLQYINTLSDLCNNAIKSGEIHDTLDSIHFYAEDIYTKLSGVGLSASKSCDGFLKKIEDIDLNLYNGG